MMSIRDALIETGNWSEEQAQLGIDFDFKCAYCEKDLISCAANHSEWQTDHITPSSKGGDDSMSNLALCCRTCNFVKGAWDPLEALDNPKASKEDLISAAKEYIDRRHEKMQADLEVYKKLSADIADKAFRSARFTRGTAPHFSFQC